MYQVEDRISDPQLHDLKLLVLELFHFAILFFMEN